VLIVTPVNWYHVSSALKLMIDRLVCADGGNPDPTTTHGKHAEEAKAIEMKGWHYPRHLAGRAFAVVVHGDTDGVNNVRRALTDWLSDIGLVQAGHAAAVGRYVDYYGKYATSHEALDRDSAFQQEVRNAAHALAVELELQRKGRAEPDQGIEDPRRK
jgi:multimeric flavodoxin WrbA